LESGKTGEIVINEENMDLDHSGEYPLKILKNKEQGLSM